MHSIAATLMWVVAAAILLLPCCCCYSSATPLLQHLYTLQYAGNVTQPSVLEVCVCAYSIPELHYLPPNATAVALLPARSRFYGLAAAMPVVAGPLPDSGPLPGSWPTAW